MKKININEDNFKKFNLNNMVEYPAILIIAKRGSGKSWIVKSLLHKFQDFPCGNIISLTEHVNPFYKNIIPDIFIYDKFSSTILENILQRQEYIKNKDIDPRFFLVLDDCMAKASEVNKNNYMSEILLNGRHHKISLIVTAQYIYNLKPEFRTNFDYIFLLADDNKINQKKIYEQFGGIIGDKKKFLEIFTKMTRDYKCMVIDAKNKEEACEKIFWYKAPDLSNISFKIGNKEFHNYHNKRYNKNYSQNKILKNQKYNIKLIK